MGAWADYTLPSSYLRNISSADFGKLPFSGDVPATAQYLIRAKGKLQSYLRADLAQFIVSMGDASFFDAIAAASAIEDPLDHALSLGYAYAHYWDKMVNIDDQWAIRARAMDSEMKAAAAALAQIIPGALGQTTSAINAPAVSAVTTIVGRQGNIATDTLLGYGS